MFLNKAINKVLLTSALDIILAVLVGNLIAIPFIFWTLYQLPATNEIVIAVTTFPDNDKLLFEWYESKKISRVEVMHDESSLIIHYPGSLGEMWQIPNSLELEAMGYMTLGKYNFYKKPYSDIISNSYNENNILSLFNDLPTEVGRLLFVLILASQFGFLIIGWRQRRSLFKNNKAFQNERTKLSKAVLFGVLTGLLLFAIGSIHEQIINWIYNNSIDTLGVWKVSGNLSLTDKIGVILLGSLFAPFCEELFFRGVIFTRFLLAGFPFLGLIISSILFAGMHFDFINTFAYFIFGIVLGWLYWKQKALLRLWSRMELITH